MAKHHSTSLTTEQHQEAVAARKFVRYSQWYTLETIERGLKRGVPASCHSLAMYTYAALWGASPRLGRSAMAASHQLPKDIRPVVMACDGLATLVPLAGQGSKARVKRSSYQSFSRASRGFVVFHGDANRCMKEITQSLQMSQVVFNKHGQVAIASGVGIEAYIGPDFTWGQSAVSYRHAFDLGLTPKMVEGKPEAAEIFKVIRELQLEDIFEPFQFDRVGKRRSKDQKPRNAKGKTVRQSDEWPTIG
jgi:hypothetical protein